MESSLYDVPLTISSLWLHHKSQALHAGIYGKLCRLCQIKKYVNNGAIVSDSFALATTRPWSSVHVNSFFLDRIVGIVVLTGLSLSD